MNNLPPHSASTAASNTPEQIRRSTAPSDSQRPVLNGKSIATAATTPSHIKNQSLHSPLHKLLCERDINPKNMKDMLNFTTKVFLSQNINQPDESGQTLLQNASNCGRTQAVKLLLDCKVEPNTFPHAQALPQTEAPVLIAAKQGHYDIVSLLADAGAYLTVTDEADKTALHHAAQQNNTQLINLLISKNADVNPVDDEGMTPLYKAAAKSHTEAVRILTKAKADLNKVDYSGNTPLLRAVMNLYPEALMLQVTFSITKGQGFEVPPTYENTVRNIKTLVDAGANLEKANSDGLTPLYAAAGKASSLSYAAQAFNTLLDAGANPNNILPDKKTIIEMLGENASEEGIQATWKNRSSLQGLCRRVIRKSINGDDDIFKLPLPILNKNYLRHNIYEYPVKRGTLEALIESNSSSSQ